MARKPNAQESVKVQPTIPAAMHGYLGEMVDLGYGATPTEAARYLILRGLDDLLRQGLIGPGTKRKVTTAGQ